LRRFPIFQEHCNTFSSPRVTASCSIRFMNDRPSRGPFLREELKQVKSTDTSGDDPIAVIYSHVEGIERVSSLADMPVLDLVARNELPHLAQCLLLESPPNPPAPSAVRRLSGATTRDPRTPETLAQDLGLPYLSLDDIAINPEIGFLMLRMTPGKKGDAPEGRARTLLLWEIAEDIFHGMPLLTDTAEVAARMYGERPKASPAPRPSPMAPQR
jgi:hypothetical protein